jgi:hypothetical protein
MTTLLWDQHTCPPLRADAGYHDPDSSLGQQVQGRSTLLASQRPSTFSMVILTRLRSS